MLVKAGTLKDPELILGLREEVQEEAWGCPASCLHPTAISLHEPVVLP